MASSVAISKLVTVVLTTSPVISHPSCALLEEVLASFCHAPDLFPCRKVIVADGCRKRHPVCSANAEPMEKEDTANTSGGRRRRKYANVSKGMRSGYVDEPYAERYDEMKRNLGMLCERDRGKTWHPTKAPFADVDLLFLPRRVGYGFALKEALESERGFVTTKYVCVIQHDRTFMRPCRVDSIVAAMDASVPPPTADCEEAGLRATQPSEQTVKSVVFLTRSTLNYSMRMEGRATIRALHANPEALTHRPPELLLDSVQGMFAPLYQFFDSTHLALVDHYRNFIFSRDRRLVSAGGFVEDSVSTALMASMKREGFVEGHKPFGCYLYDDGRAWQQDDYGAEENAMADSLPRNAHRLGNGAMPLVGHLDGGSFLTNDQRALQIKGLQR